MMVPAGVFKILDQLRLVTVRRTKSNRPTLVMKPRLAQRALSKQVLGFKTATAIRGRDGLNRFDAGKLFRHSIGLAILNDISKLIQPLRRRLNKQLPQASGCDDWA